MWECNVLIATYAEWKLMKIQYYGCIFVATYLIGTNQHRTGEPGAKALLQQKVNNPVYFIYFQANH